MPSTLGNAGLTRAEQQVLREALSPWEFFVLRHTKRGNLIVHFLSFVVYWASPTLALSTGDWRWLIGLPLSGIIAAPAHYIFDDGGISVREATFSPSVVMFVTIMFWRIARGLYGEDIAKARARYDEIKANGAID